MNEAWKRLLAVFQLRADGFAKAGTEKGNAISNEYLTVISDIQHGIDFSGEPDNLNNLLHRMMGQAEENKTEILKRISQIESKIMALETTLDAQIADLTTEVTNETTVEKSALTLIQGIPALIAAAIAKASAAGATTAQLQALSDLQTTLAANDSELSAAVVANTPAAS